MPPEDLVKSIFGDTGNPAPNNDPAPKAPEDNKDTPPEDGKKDGTEPKKPDEKEPEKLLAGKYKTVEELEKAYIESQKDFHLDRQDKAELKKELENIKKALEPKKPEEDPDKRREKILQRLVEEPEAVIMELADKIADKKVQERLGPIAPVVQQMVVNNQVQAFMSAVPDANEYAEDMAKIIEARPEITKKKDWMENVYLAAKTARLEAKLAGKDTGQKGKAAEDEKKAAAAAIPKGTKGEPPAPETDEEKIKKSIFGEAGGQAKMFDF